MCYLFEKVPNYDICLILSFLKLMFENCNKKHTQNISKHFQSNIDKTGTQHSKLRGIYIDYCFIYLFRLMDIYY